MHHSGGERLSVTCNPKSSCPLQCVRTHRTLRTECRLREFRQEPFLNVSKKVKKNAFHFLDEGFQPKKAASAHTQKSEKIHTQYAPFSGIMRMMLIYAHTCTYVYFLNVRVRIQNVLRIYARIYAFLRFVYIRAYCVWADAGY